MSTKPKGKKNPHAVALGKMVAEKYSPAYMAEIGRRGGKKGGASTKARHGAKHFSAAGKKGGGARAKKLSAAQRREIGRKAIAARWARKRSPAGK